MDSYIDSPWFHLPDEPVADFQRAVGMARGTLIRMGRHGGVVEVDGFRYELVDHRRPPWREQCPLAKFAGRLLGFNFYPTYSPQEAAELEPDEPPRLKLSQLRREVPAPNLVEVIGTVAEAGGGRMLVQLTSHQGARPWVVPLVGRYPGGVGERVQLTARLEAGQLRYLDHRLLAPGAMTIADAMRAAGGPALPASAAR